MLPQIADRDVCALFREQDRNGTPDAAVPVGDERDSVLQFAASEILRGGGWPGGHLVLASRLLALGLWWKCLFFL